LTKWWHGTIIEGLNFFLATTGIVVTVFITLDRRETLVAQTCLSEGGEGHQGYKKSAERNDFFERHVYFDFILFLSVCFYWIYKPFEGIDY